MSTINSLLQWERNESGCNSCDAHPTIAPCVEMHSGYCVTCMQEVAPHIFTEAKALGRQFRTLCLRAYWAGLRGDMKLLYMFDERGYEISLEINRLLGTDEWQVNTTPDPTAAFHMELFGHTITGTEG